MTIESVSLQSPETEPSRASTKVMEQGKTPF